MTEGPSPYAAPLSVGVPPALTPEPPPQVKVLGILHLVFGGIGGVWVLIAVAMKGVTESMYAAQEKAGGVQAEQARISRALTESMQSLTYFGYGVSSLLTVLLVLAGLGLLKRRRSGLTWSNAYAWSAITLRLLTIVLFIVYALPKMNTMIEHLTAGGKSDPTFVSIMKGSMIGGVVVGPLFYCIYPVLVLILLNRDSVRKALQ